MTDRLRDALIDTFTHGGTLTVTLMAAILVGGFMAILNTEIDYIINVCLFVIVICVAVMVLAFIVCPKQRKEDS